MKYNETNRFLALAMYEDKEFWATINESLRLTLSAGVSGFYNKEID